MSSHADTIRNLLARQRNNEELRAGFDALDALLAENQRLRDALERIAKSGSYAHDRPTTLFAATDIAREALAGDAE